MSDEQIFESTRIISEDEVPPDVLEKFRLLEESRKSEVTKAFEAGKVQNIGAVMSAAQLKIDTPPDKKIGERGTALAAQLVHAAKVGEEKRNERIHAKAKSLVESVSRSLKRDADKNVPV